MTYQEFIDLIKTKAHEELSYDLDLINFYPEGYTSDDPQMLEWIIDTNSKFIEGETSPWLKSDFLVLNRDLGNGMTAMQRIETRTCYEEVETKGFDAVFEEIRKNNQYTLPLEALDKRVSMEYPALRDQLIIRPLNYGLHMQELNNCVYRKFSDFVLVLYQFLGHNNGNLTTSKITRTELKNWSVAEEVAMKNAMENSMRMFPPCVYNKTLQKEVNFLTEDFSKEDITFSYLNQVSILLSTFGTINGAIALFYPGVVEKMMKILGDSFWAVFMNINDVMIYEKKYKSLARNCSDTAKQSTRMGEMLSGRLYLCDEKGINYVNYQVERIYQKYRFGIILMRKSSHYKKNRAAFYKRLKKMPKINKETIEAMQETLDIESGKIPAKRYKSARELFEDNNKYLYRQNVSK